MTFWPYFRHTWAMGLVSGVLAVQLILLAWRAAIVTVLATAVAILVIEICEVLDRWWTQERP